jgi:FAD:protein FMN transferase
MNPQSFAYESMGTGWNISIWDTIDDRSFEKIRTEIIRRSEEFDRLYSRFIESSLVWNLARSGGTHAVPRDLVAMLRIFEKLHALSDGACNPLVGFSLSDLGYDKDYSLSPKETIRTTPLLQETLRIIDDEHIELSQPVLIDIGALGKDTSSTRSRRSCENGA